MASTQTEQARVTEHRRPRAAVEGLGHSGAGSLPVLPPRPLTGNERAAGIPVVQQRQNGSLRPDDLAICYLDRSPEATILGRDAHGPTGVRETRQRRYEGDVPTEAGEVSAASDRGDGRVGRADDPKAGVGGDAFAGDATFEDDRRRRGRAMSPDAARLAVVPPGEGDRSRGQTSVADPAPDIPDVAAVDAQADGAGLVRGHCGLLRNVDPCRRPVRTASCCRQKENRRQ